MTRINVGIPPKNLSDQHLLAEHREIKRLPFSFLKWIRSKKRTPIPLVFTLGKGHVLFFIDKAYYTWKRYNLIYLECKSRGFKVEYYGHNWDLIPEAFKRDYLECNEDKELISERIISNASTSKQIPKYNKKKITIDEYRALIYNRQNS